MEKRAYKRLDLPGGLLLKVKNGRERLVKGSLDNFGFGGFQTRLSGDLYADQEVEFQLMTRFQDAPLKGRGKIRHVKKLKRFWPPFSAAGVEFSQADICGVRNLIKKGLKRKDRQESSRNRFFQDFSWFIKFVPFLILASWFTATATGSFAQRMDESRKFDRELKAGVLHYLNSY
jgi:hypothetical protein